MFPQFAPYTDPLRVLICGGSSGPGAPVVLDNCVSIEPEAEEPTWTLERMVRNPSSALVVAYFLLLAIEASHELHGRPS